MRTFSRVSALSLAAMAMLSSAGCLRKEVTHTVYLTPSGVVWSTIEKDVRSDETDAAKAAAEEQDYVIAAGAGQHPVAVAFRRLGARSVTTTWLRRERPYTVVTEGRFADLRQLALAILRDAGAAGDAALVRDGCRATFTARVDVDSAPESSGQNAVDALLEDLDAYRFVLTEGRFVSADGFVIEQDGAVARPDAGKTAADGVLTLMLAWMEDGC
jgi:hypothetical protein